MLLNTIAPWHPGQESWAAVLALAAVVGLAVGCDELAADSSALGSSRFAVAAFTTGSSVTSVFSISAASSELTSAVSSTRAGCTGPAAASET